MQSSAWKAPDGISSLIYGRDGDGLGGLFSPEEIPEMTFCGAPLGGPRLANVLDAKKEASAPLRLLLQPLFGRLR
jgi:hypothetical protein